EAASLKQLSGAEGDLLEIGCATGLFLRAAAETGFRVQGCDPWREAAAIAAEQFGSCVKNSGFHVADYEAGCFRAFAMVDVIEHVEDPVQLVNDIHQLLASGGWLALSTPNFDSWSRRILQSRWHFLERPHLTFFTPETISNLLRSSGFSDIRIRGQWKTYS